MEKSEIQQGLSQANLRACFCSLTGKGGNTIFYPSAYSALMSPNPPLECAQERHPIVLGLCRTEEKLGSFLLHLCFCAVTQAILNKKEFSSLVFPAGGNRSQALQDTILWFHL